MIRNIIKIKKSNFVRNVVVIMSGTALAQILTFLLMPIVTRIYGPEPIGMLGTYNAIIMILGSLAALTLPIAIVLPKEDKKAREIVSISLLISFFIALLSICILLFFSNAITDTFQLDINSSIYFIPFLIIFIALSQIMEQWLIRKQSFNIQAKSSILQSLILNLSKIGVGKVYPFAITLVALQTIAVFIKFF